jgi:hypothetical protein
MMNASGVGGAEGDGRETQRFCAHACAGGQSLDAAHTKASHAPSEEHTCVPGQSKSPSHSAQPASKAQAASAAVMHL